MTRIEHSLRAKSIMKERKNKQNTKDVEIPRKYVFSNTDFGTTYCIRGMHFGFMDFITM